MEKTILVTFLCLTMSTFEVLSCMTDRDCEDDSICYAMVCRRRKYLDEECLVDRQCYGFNVKCDIISHICRCWKDGFIKDGINCRYNGICTSDSTCGNGYTCVSGSCQIYNPFSWVAISGMLLGGIFTFIMIGFLVMILHRRQRLTTVIHIPTQVVHPPTYSIPNQPPPNYNACT